jgi:hypothetical protein
MLLFDRLVAMVILELSHIRMLTIDRNEYIDAYNSMLSTNDYDEYDNRDVFDNDEPMDDIGECALTMSLIHPEMKMVAYLKKTK